MTALRIVVGIAWITVLVVSVRAIQQLGVDGVNIFFDDFAQPWRAQFNTDFSAHLLLMAMWIFYREPQRWLGVLGAVLAICFGGAFSLAYVLVATFRARGDTRQVLLGKHA